MSYDPNNDPEFDDFAARMDAAETSDVEEQLAKDIGARRAQAENPIRQFALNLPKNIGIGAYKGLVNTLDTASEVMSEVSPKAIAAKAVGGEEMQEAVSPSLSEMYPEVMDSVRNFTSSWERNDNMGDDVAQGVAQFTLPFMGWLKMLKGVGPATKVGTVARVAGAESATTASAFDPHDGRVADLLELGRESDTRFGELLRKAAPDGSLVNAYIDYMTERENEGENEGRFKNVVDSLVSSGALAGLIKGTAGAMKFGKFLIDDMGVSGGPGPKYQKGMVQFHGTPHDFDAFDMSKLGTGEGAQVYGHGLYFADAEDVGKHYRRVLTRSGVPKGSAMDHAITAAENANWDAKQAYSSLMQAAAKTRDSQQALLYIRAAEQVKNGNVKQRGRLMTVEIPDEAIAKMLDWDKPFSAQPPSVQKAVRSIGLKNKSGQDVLGMIDQGLADPTGKDILDMLGGSTEGTSQLLKDAGVPGIRYDDGMTRKGGAATRNTVLFDDSLVKITKKE